MALYSSALIPIAPDHSVDIEKMLATAKRPELSDTFLGSTATRVARRSNATIVIVR